ncbi:cystathionine gamma-synthase family protein [Pelistega europaea]|uniref:Cystathionine gamma-synthase family protein n=1 Tax=Pelistega europaea TaxID=106147 RepID=A0A7Y4LA42_9BURK|nr:cystathionine gamma-synthase family protein [Pelistega europaea]NOL49688.1 cystathionine gamma-synthase family protein [Pelistega europaea]
MSSQNISTKIVHADRRQKVEHNAIHKPIHVSAQYSFNDVRDLIAVFGNTPGYAYSRQGTPTVTAMENKVSLLEEGIATIGFASGMAAIAAVMLTLLKAGDHFISSRFIFGNTKSLFSTLEQLGIEVTMVDTTNINEVKAAIRPNTRMLFTETIGNPVTQVSDLKAMGDFCEAQGLIYFVDMTMVTPYLLKGKEIKASLVMHSLSKSICGHANALGGSVTDTGLFDWSRYPNILDVYRSYPLEKQGITQIKKKGLRDMGATLSSEAANRIALGMETFELRAKKANDNALALARYMQESPIFAEVKYPGLENHPQHQLAKTLFKGKGYGSLIATSLRDDIDLIKFLNNLNTIILATHLGDNRTLCLPVAPTIYAEASPEQRALMGISDNLLRISVGIEDVNDLIADFEQAYQKTVSA